MTNKLPYWLKKKLKAAKKKKKHQVNKTPKVDYSEAPPPLIKKEYSGIQKTVINSMKKKSMSFYEEIIFKVLQKLRVKNYHNYLIEDVTVNKKRKCLFYDFYLPDYKAAIEYDGPDHFFDKDADKLAFRQKNDFMKNIYSSKNRIKLLRIKYTDKDRLPEIVEKFIADLVVEKIQMKNK